MVVASSMSILIERNWKAQRMVAGTPLYTRALVSTSHDDLARADRLIPEKRALYYRAACRGVAAELPRPGPPLGHPGPGRAVDHTANLARSGALTTY
jgi:hypothetical protein